MENEILDAMESEHQHSVTAISNKGQIRVAISQEGRFAPDPSSRAEVAFWIRIDMASPDPVTPGEESTAIQKTVELISHQIKVAVQSHINLMATQTEDF